MWNRKSGDLVKVADGYVWNFLVIRAALANSRNLKAFEHERILIVCEKVQKQPKHADWVKGCTIAPLRKKPLRLCGREGHRRR
jgi:hypothetical protein